MQQSLLLLLSCSLYALQLDAQAIHRRTTYFLVANSYRFATSQRTARVQDSRRGVLALALTRPPGRTSPPSAQSSKDSPCLAARQLFPLSDLQLVSCFLAQCLMVSQHLSVSFACIERPLSKNSWSHLTLSWLLFDSASAPLLAGAFQRLLSQSYQPGPMLRSRRLSNCRSNGTAMASSKQAKHGPPHSLGPRSTVLHT